MSNPSLRRGLKSLATIAGVSVLTAAPAAHASTFLDTLSNVSKTYNLYVSGDIGSTSSPVTSDTEGKVAAGGDAYFQNYEIGAKDPGGAALVVGGDLKFQGGTIHGNVVTGGKANFPSGSTVQGTVSAGGGVASAPTSYSGTTAFTNLPFDFTSTTADLAAASAYLAKPAAQGQGVLGTVALNYSTLTFTSSATSGLVFFDVTAAQLANINLKFDVSSLVTVIVNVTGQQTANTTIGGQGFDGVTATNTLFNFEDASSLNLASFNGSILATNAAITANNGRIDGSVMAKSYAGTTQLNSFAFNGALPSPPGTPTAAIPEPASWAMMILGVGAVGAVLRRRRRLANEQALASA